MNVKNMAPLRARWDPRTAHPSGAQTARASASAETCGRSFRGVRRAEARTGACDAVQVGQAGAVRVPRRKRVVKQVGREEECRVHGGVGLVGGGQRLARAGALVHRVGDPTPRDDGVGLDLDGVQEREDEGKLRRKRKRVSIERTACECMRIDARTFMAAPEKKVAQIARGTAHDACFVSSAKLAVVDRVKRRPCKEEA